MKRMFTVVLALLVGILVLPTVARAADRGSYTVSGLGSRKQAVLNNGGTVLDLAIAMLETERMTPTTRTATARPATPRTSASSNRTGT
jgi:hypothetical protein